MLGEAWESVVMVWRSVGGGVGKCWGVGSEGRCAGCGEVLGCGK